MLTKISRPCRRMNNADLTRGCGSRLRNRNQSGMTLLELLIAMFMTVLLLSPIAAFFFTSLNASQRVDERFKASAEAQRVAAAWTKDVQSVDPGGVNAVDRCIPAGGVAGADEVDLVHFTSNTDRDNPSHNGGPDRKSVV